MRGSFLFGVMGTVLTAGAAMAAPLPPTAGRTDLALGKKVLMAPPPDGGLTAEGGTDAMDLTDGKTVQDAHKPLWWDASSVKWSYPGRVNLAVDLGKPCDIDEIAMRFQNVGWGPGVMFPGWVEAFVSSDGKHYEKVAEFSHWHQGDFKRFNIEQTPDLAKLRWVDVLRFKNLKAHGRWVALRIYGGELLVSDELYVFGKPAGGATASQPAADSDFTITHPYVYFHKPYLELATNVALPVPVGIVLPPNAGENQSVTLTLDLPAGLKLANDVAQNESVQNLRFEALPAASGENEGRQRYRLETKASVNTKVFARLYLEAPGWRDGQKGELRYQFGNGTWQSPVVSLPVSAVNVPAAPRLKTIMASLGWWNGPRMAWPDQLEAYRIIGLNTVNIMGVWMPTNKADPQWAMLDKARKDGFFISNIDSPLYEILRHHKDDREIYDQFADGSVGKHLCISYRGKYYQEEIRRFAAIMATVKPNFSSEDIELWSGGPSDSRKCTRCQADFKKSGLKSWEAWEQAKGKEIIHDLVTAARKAVAEAGGAPFSTGVYDFRPGEVYQKLFNFNQLYPQLLNTSQASTYTSLQPADLVYIGDEARKDRAQLPHSDQMPWNTPGDAGTFCGEDFQWSLLENYCNGSRGIWFWSSRMWDSEDLIAYNKVIRAIAPVEDVIVNGDLVGSDAAVIGPGRISGMKQGKRMVLLAADYFHRTTGSIRLRLKLPGKSTLKDLMTGQSIGNTWEAGEQTVTIPLNGQRGRLVEVVSE